MEFPKEKEAKPASNVSSTDISSPRPQGKDHFLGEYTPVVTSDTIEIPSHLQERDRKLKHQIRYLRLLVRLAATVLAIATLSQEGQTIYTFYHTRDNIVNNRGPWAKQTTIWSSLLMFSISLISSLLGIAIVCGYLVSIKTANKVSSMQTKFMLLTEVGHLVIWIAVAVAYRAGKNGHDLWGWACSPLAEKLQANYQGVVDFDEVCRRGDRTWVVSIANAAVTAVGLVVWGMVLERMRTKKTLKRMTMTMPGAV